MSIRNIPSNLNYAGAAPGLVTGSPTGSAIPLSLAIGGSAAQVTIAVR